MEDKPKWMFQEQWDVYANGGNIFHHEVFNIDPEHPEIAGKKARDCRADYLVRYPGAEVNMVKNNRLIYSRLGRFYVSVDRKYAVDCTDNNVYYELPNTHMTDIGIQKHLNDIYFGK